MMNPNLRLIMFAFTMQNAFQLAFFSWSTVSSFIFDQFFLSLNFSCLIELHAMIFFV